MGGALSYYLAVELLTSGVMLPPGIRIKIVTFGSPRIGDQAFASLWEKLVEEYRSNHGQLSFQEYNVRAYNDGGSVARSYTPSAYKITPDSLQGSLCCHP